MTIIDTNDNVSAHLPQLKARGVTAIGRYYSSSPSKRVTRPEAAAIKTAGFELFVIFEDNGDPLLTTQNGVFHGQIALNQAKAIGQPTGSAIYFALEHLPSGYTKADVEPVERYIAGVSSVLADRYKVGVYSDGVICDALLTAGLCDFTWLSASSSFEGTKAFHLSNRWSLAQDSHVDQQWDGLSVDLNDANGDFGAFEVGDLTAAAPAAVAPAGMAAPVEMAAMAPMAALAALPAGWLFHLKRLRQERRAGEGFDRTVGTYTVLHDGRPVPISGMTVERQGPGNNGPTGVASHTCIESGLYPLQTHGTPKYATAGFATDGSHPRPAIEVGKTGRRTGILIHPADGYGSTIGCINLADQLDDADSDIRLLDSTARVVALINDIIAFAGPLPHAQETPIPSAHLLIEDFS